jgi:putative transposase
MKRKLKQKTNGIIYKEGNTINFLLSEKLDKSSEVRFFMKAIGSSGLPEKITIDKSGSNQSGINFINAKIALLIALGFPYAEIQVRQIKYFNTWWKDHRRIKRIMNPMLGFKSIFIGSGNIIWHFESCQMLKKGQHSAFVEQVMLNYNDLQKDLRLINVFSKHVPTIPHMNFSFFYNPKRSQSWQQVQNACLTLMKKNRSKNLMYGKQNVKTKTRKNCL